MDGRQGEYPQSGLSSPYAHYNSHLSETSSADQSSAVQYSGGQDYKSSNFSSSATPDSSYGLPPSARSGTFPEYLQRSYPEGQQPQSRYSSGAPSGSHAMAQTSSLSPSSMPDGQQPNGHAHHHHMKSDTDVPIDPSIAQSSPSYPPPQYASPYQPASHDMAHYQSQQMPYGRPDWPQQGYGQPMYGQPPTTGGAVPNMQAHVPRPTQVRTVKVKPLTPTNTRQQGSHPLSTVYSFVPIPGAQQHKRPRRRYEEIERMYKCGWNGCEKAYGTLNHLNAHVTMQSHGQKRTPEGKSHNPPRAASSRKDIAISSKDDVVASPNAGCKRTLALLQATSMLDFSATRSYQPGGTTHDGM